MRQTRRILAVATLAGAVVAGALVAPSAAFAAQNNNVTGEVYPGGGWTPGGVTRHKTDTGDIKVKITDNVDGGICLRLRSTRNNAVFGERCWAAGSYLAYTVSTDVLTGTEFVIDARKRTAGGSNNKWKAIAHY
jgi:hypothetical protein